MTHPVHDETAAAFRSIFDLYKLANLWDATRSSNNPYARGTYWTDASKSMPCSGCTAQDDAASGVDSADVIYVHTHGGHSFDYWGFNNIPGMPYTPSYSVLAMGSASYGCNVYTHSNMQFGDGDLEVAVVKACQSGDRDVWLDGGYDFITSSGGFSMWNAFHGDSSCGDHVTDYVGSYAAGSMNDGMGENWLDEAYDSWGADDCPTSIVWGSSYTNRHNQFAYGGFRDRKSTGTKSASSMWYFAGCDPDGGSTMPD
jgi:hypothetical protein